MKRMISSAILAVWVAVSMTGCSKMPDERLMEKGKKYEQKQKFKEALAQYEKLVSQFPKSPKVPAALYNMGNVYMYGLQDYPKAVETFTQITETYSDTLRLVAQSQFLIGFVYNNFAPDTAKARAAYLKFLEKYPKHELAASVKWEVEHLGKDINSDPMFTK
jgi:tetratricopeptide (TPR) repeat protein